MRCSVSKKWGGNFWPEAGIYHLRAAPSEEGGIYHLKGGISKTRAVPVSWRAAPINWRHFSAEDGIYQLDRGTIS